MGIYLDCGCCITDDGHRSWCPSCFVLYPHSAPPPLESKVYPAADVERLVKAARFGKVMINHFIHGETGTQGMVEVFDELKAALAAFEVR